MVFRIDTKETAQRRQEDSNGEHEPRPGEVRSVLRQQADAAYCVMSIRLDRTSRARRSLLSVCFRVLAVDRSGAPMPDRE